MNQYTHDINPGPGSYRNPQTNSLFSTSTANLVDLLSNTQITGATGYPDVSNEMEDRTYTSSSTTFTLGETGILEKSGSSSIWDLSSRLQITPERIAARTASCKRRRESTALPTFMLPKKKQRPAHASGNDQNGRRRSGYRRRVLQPSSIASGAHGVPPQVIRQGSRSRARGRRRVVMRDGKVIVLRLRRRGRPVVRREADPEVDIMAGDIMKMGI